ncbi:hypothetical protein Glove_464g21 [Diversispora epigaea]|uniref:SH3 domain-containing protein n=1 Tax=Diversispora epigaea TaxID=1348612 RepID=A0A397GMA3_9GLOM|nr:hypothetical protein Glove_464g21 [Diversispora epigaea]
MRTISILSILSLVFISIIFSISQQNAHVDARLIINENRKRLSYRHDDSEIFIKKRNPADRFHNNLQARAPKDPKDPKNPKDPKEKSSSTTNSPTEEPSSSSDSSTSSEINIDVATSLAIATSTTSSATSATSATTSTTSNTSSITASATTSASSYTPSVATTNTSSNTEQDKKLNVATTTSAATINTNNSSASNQSVPTGGISSTGIALIVAVCGIFIIFVGMLTYIRKKKRRQMTDTIVATSSVAWEQQNSTYEKLEEETSDNLPPQPKPIGSYTVIATYTPTLPDELDIQPGDKVAILVEYDDGWVQGINETRGGTKGVFPRHCVDMNIALNNKRSSSMGTYSVVDLN